VQLAGASANRIENAAKIEGTVGQFSDADETVEKAGEMGKCCKGLMDKVGLVVKIGDALAEVGFYYKPVLSLTLIGLSFFRFTPTLRWSGQYCHPLSRCVYMRRRKRD
jgi:hypothetical protein